MFWWAQGHLISGGDSLLMSVAGHSSHCMAGPNLPLLSSSATTVPKLERLVLCITCSVELSAVLTKLSALQTEWT